LNNKEIVERITWIEAHSKVLDIKYGGILFWPYLRQLISLQLFKKTANNIVRRKSIKFSSLVSLFRALRSIYFSDRVHNLENIFKSDALILIHTSSRQEKLNDKFYCRTSDAIIDFFEDKLSLSTWEYSLQNNYPQPRYRSTEYIDVPLFIYMALGACVGLIRQVINPKLTKPIHMLNKAMQVNNMATKLPIVATICKIYSILYLAKYFEKRLARIEPRIVFIPEFYNAISMALSLACYRRNIVSVEYQHGAQNDYHRMYTHWGVVPEKGYELIPKYFWSWGSASAERIRRWASKSSYHKVIIGGNLWMLKTKTGFENNDLVNHEHQLYYPAGKKHILITLQKWPDHFNFELVSIIKHSPPNWCWHIRQHPLHKFPAEEMKKYFEDTQLKNVEIEYSTKASLYSLLKSVVIHLTGFSTVAFEAQSFNVPTIFFHGNALHGFSGLIDNREFYYADNEHEIMDCLHKLLSGKMRIPSSSGEYIIISEKVASDALTTIIGIR